MKVLEKVEAILASAKQGIERDRLSALRWLCKSPTAFIQLVKKFGAHHEVVRHARLAQSRRYLSKKSRTILLTIAALRAAAEKVAELIFLASCGKKCRDAIDSAVAELKTIAQLLRAKFGDAQLDLGLV